MTMSDQFRFFLTSKRLIEFLRHAKLVIQTDETYKLLWLQNPILLIDRVLYPQGLALILGKQRKIF